jgi:hypothetical protein
MMMLVFLFFIVQLLPARAADLQNRTIILQSSVPSTTTSHTFRFINPTAGTLGSIKFEYCQNSPLFFVSCTPPAGLNLSSSTLTSQVGNVGFTKDALSTATTLVISRTPGGTLSTTNVYQFNNAVNPSAVNATYFVRISLYATNNATGSSFDQGSVAFSTSNEFSIGGFVPPFLTFCVGVTVALNCSSSNGSLVNFGELEPGRTSSVTTQFAAATNSPTGLQVFLNGQTLTSGNNVIPAIASRTASNAGSSQFGVNLRANSSPSIGANSSGPGTTQATTDYNTQNQYKFASGEVIARSALPTDYNLFTVSYIANVSEDQPAGVYATTLAYTALVTF